MNILHAPIKHKPIAETSFDPPANDDAKRSRFEESRWDNVENLYDDFNAGIEAIFGDQAKMDDLAEDIRDGDTCHLGLMIRNAALQAREDYVGDHFDELVETERKYVEGY